MSKSFKKRPIGIVAGICRQVLKDEKSTPEGRVNNFTLLLGLIAAITIPLLSGSRIVLEGGADGWSFNLTFGDAFGSLFLLISAGLVCVLIVGGCNIFRRRDESRNARGPSDQI